EAREDLGKFEFPNWAKRVALLALLTFLAIIGYLMYPDIVNPHWRIAGEAQLTTDPEGHAVLPAIPPSTISPSRMRMVYTEERRLNIGHSQVESVLNLVEIVDGAPRDPQPIARSFDGLFKGAAFVPNDDQTVFVVLQ